MFGRQFVYAVVKVGWSESGEPFKCPDEMGLIVVIVIRPGNGFPQFYYETYYGRLTDVRFI